MEQHFVVTIVSEDEIMPGQLNDAAVYGIDGPPVSSIFTRRAAQAVSGHYVILEEEEVDDTSAVGGERRPEDPPAEPWPGASQHLRTGSPPAFKTIEEDIEGEDHHATDN